MLQFPLAWSVCCLPVSLPADPFLRTANRQKISLTSIHSPGVTLLPVSMVLSGLTLKESYFRFTYLHQLESFSGLNQVELVEWSLRSSEDRLSRILGGHNSSSE